MRCERVFFVHRKPNGLIADDVLDSLESPKDRTTKGHPLSKTLRSEILGICRETASPHDIVAASIQGLNADVDTERKKDVTVLLVLSSPKLTLKYQTKRIEETTISLLMVDQNTFEKDVEKDWLGGLLVENMLVPYEPLVDGDFLWDQEVKAKRRIIGEILANLVLEYPQMSHELLIKPEYFLFEAMARKASLYPPISYRFLNMFGGDVGEKNREIVMEGFKAALDTVAEENLVTLSDGYTRITEKCASTIQRRKLRVLTFLKVVRNSILRHSFEVFPKMMRSLLEDYGLHVKRFVDGEDSGGIALPELEDPKSFIFIPTSSGLVSLSDKMTIEDYVKRTVPDGNALEVEIERLGGVLNAVYMLKIRREKEENVIVKIFKDWYGWKWFPLALWALGTRGFAILGKSRLEREYAINRFLSSQGFNVPQIVYASPKERLIFQEYVEGTSLTDVIKQICSSDREKQDLADPIENVGKEIAKIHELGVALGDCKPENIIIAPDGGIYFVDLEQAERGGDQAWDVAELLYYSGHYASIAPIQSIRTIARAFIRGYLEAGGKKENIGGARSPKYVKVFSFFTPPHILLVISTVCGEALKGTSPGKRNQGERTVLSAD